MQVLQNLIQDNTEKLSLLTILEEEQGKLHKILKHLPESEVIFVQIFDLKIFILLTIDFNRKKCKKLSKNTRMI